MTAVPPRPAAPDATAGDGLREALIEAARAELACGTNWYIPTGESIADALLDGPLRDVLAAAARDAEKATIGAALIATERQRQIDAEGWTPEHDAEHKGNALALAAECYLVYGAQPQQPALWPWRARDWKPTPDDRVRQLVKAGALIAAEIDRLQSRRALDPS